jgi:hypothetical protein
MFCKLVETTDIQYEILLESCRTVIAATASVKDERGGQGHTSANLLHQSAT